MLGSRNLLPAEGGADRDRVVAGEYHTRRPHSTLGNRPPVAPAYCPLVSPPSSFTALSSDVGSLTGAGTKSRPGHPPVIHVLRPYQMGAYRRIALQLPAKAPPVQPARAGGNEKPISSGKPHHKKSVCTPERKNEARPAQRAIAC